MVRIRAIGKSEVHVGRSRIKPDSVMLFALALYLGLTAGERIARARLLDVFWPGVADQSRRHALRQLLYRLRRSGLTLALDGEELFLDSDQVDCDMGALLAPTWPDEAPVDAVIAAAEVLPGYMPPMPAPYRAWLDGLRARMSAQFRRAVLRQISCARAEGRWADVDEWARRCLDTDPLNEEATCARAEAVAMTGSKDRAQQILDDYLWELGDRHKMIGLPAKMLRGRISEMVGEALPSRFEPVPLVGRSVEIASLNQALETTLGGTSAAVIVVGVPGIGKSTVALEIVSSARLRGWRSVVVRLQPSDRHRPLAVFVDLFSAMLRMPGALGCDPASLTQLQRLTEHSVADESASLKSQEAEAVQERIRAAATDLLGAVSDDGPMIVLLEDLHSIDEESTRLLQHLLARTQNLPIFWLLTARPEARYASLRRALPEELVRGVRLGPLSPEDAVTLYRAFSVRSSPVDEGTLREIADTLTRGNPLFIREVAKHVAETGSAASLPHSLRSLIRDRVERLQPLAQHVLHTCAVLGRYSSVPRVASVLEIGTAGLLVCIEELDALGILGAGKDADALALHDLWQEELLSSLLPASRQLIHHRCGAVLEAESRETRSASMVWEAARHLKASGAHGRALSLLEGCAQHLLDNGLPVEAARTFELAFEASATDHERLRALSGRLSALHRAGDWAEIARVIEPAIALESRCSEQLSRHSNLELLRTESLYRTETDSNACLERALACVFDETATSSHRAHAALIASVAASNLARLDDLRRLYETVEALPCVALEDRAQVLGVATIFHTELGSLDQALEVAEKRVEIERRLGSVRGLVRALHFASYPLRCLGQFDRGLLLLREALELAERHHLVGDAASTADSIVTSFLERGDIAGAKASLARADFWVRRVSARYAHTGHHINRAVIALAEGDVDTACALVHTDVEKHANDPLLRQRVVNLSISTRILMARGMGVELSIGVNKLRESLQLTKTTGRQDYFVASYALALAALDSTPEAVRFVHDYLQHARRDRSAPSQELITLAKA